MQESGDVVRCGLARQHTSHFSVLYCSAPLHMDQAYLEMVPFYLSIGCFVHCTAMLIVLPCGLYRHGRRPVLCDVLRRCAWTKHRLETVLPAALY